ncbi:hypothetical protein HMPREF3050_04770 [Neisseria sp. HMSC065D04]|nr:hypothetical protein HMPREF3050_04770 [Neisseria sp. HMSC065D04]
MGKRENPKKRIRRLRPILQLLITTYKENNMKTWKTLLGAAAFTLTLTSAAVAETAYVPGLHVTEPNQLVTAKKVKRKDLFGMWGNTSKNADGSLLNASLMRPDGTGRDLIHFQANSGDTTTITQDFKWKFSRWRQEFRQTITNYTVSHNDGAPEQKSDEIGKTVKFKVPLLLKLEGKPNVLEMTNKEGTDSVRYYRYNEEAMPDLLKKLEAQ